MTLMNIILWPRSSVAGTFFLIVSAITFVTGPVSAQLVKSRDAYIRLDNSAKECVFGTSQIEETVRFEKGVYKLVSFVNKAAHRQYAGAESSEEFRLRVNGETYTGASGGWTWRGAATKSINDGEVQLTVTLENKIVQVTKTYVVYADTSIIRQWVIVKNISSQPITVVDPYFLATRLRVHETNELTLFYMTGGGYFTGSQIMKSVSLSDKYSRTFDSTDKTERTEISDVSFGGALPWGSGAYMQWFCVQGKSDGGLFVGFDYYGRWAANIGNYFGEPGYIGLHVAGYKEELAPSESITTPKGFTGVFMGDLDEMGNQLKEWQYRYLWDYKNRDFFGKVRYAAEMRVQSSKTDVVVGGGTQDNWDYRMSALFHAIDVMRSVGADILWQDAGWHDHLGDNDGPEFSQVEAYLNNSGMKLAIWWPLYSVSSSSRVSQEHPEWVANPQWPGLNLDTSKPQVINYLLGQLDQKVRLWGNFQWRLDGTSVVPVGTNETPMLTAYHNVMGLFAAFHNQHPNSSIDICSGGGNLMGFETLRMSDVSQLTDGGALQNSNYYSSYLFPPDNIDDWTRDDNFTWAKARAALTMAPAWMSDRGVYGFEPGLLLNDGKENLRRTFETYHYLIQQGVAGRWSLVYHPRVAGDDPAYYFERLSQDRRRGVLILKHFMQGEITVYPKGLIADDTYDIRFARSHAISKRTGADLMRKGITLLNPQSGELIYLGLPNHPGSGTDKIPPTIPTHVTKQLGVNMGVTGVELKWESSNDDNWVSYYQIYRDGRAIDKVAKGTYYFDHTNGGEVISSTYEVQAVDGDGNVSQQARAVEVQGTALTYTARGGFLSGEDHSYQGANGWSYEEWSEQAHTLMTWNGALGQMGLYEGSEVDPQQPAMGASWVHPSTSADAVRVFTIPYDGTVTVSGDIHKDLYHTYGDGIRAKILKDDVQIWPNDGWQAVEGQDSIGKNMKVRAAVKKGDKLYFVVNKRENSVEDDTVWNPTIVYDEINERLKKTHFHVTDDDSTRLAYIGTGWQSLGRNPWSSDIDSGYLSGWYSGTLTVSATAGDRLEAAFHGTGVRIIGQIGSDRGIAAIKLDGSDVGTIDTYTPAQIINLTSSQREIRQAAQWPSDPPVILWGAQGLPDTDHILVVTVSGQKNEKSAGTKVGIDGVIVTDGSVIPFPKKTQGEK